MRKCDVIVTKILYHSQETAYTVFKGTVLRWAARKKQFLPTKETHIFVGYFFCLFNGDRLEVNVEEIFHKTYGSQYLVSYSKRAEPASLIEIRNFLLKNVKGMKPTWAEKVLDKYGLDTIYQIKTDSHALDFLGLQQDTVDGLRNSLLENAVFENTMAFLQLHEVDCRFALPLHLKYKDNAGLTLTDNPYIPFIDGIFDFKTADKLYLHLGKPSNSPKRCLYTTLATLQMDVERVGNVFTRRENLKRKIMSFLTETAKDMKEEDFPFSDRDIENAVTRLENLDLIVVDKAFGTEAVYLRENYYDEMQVSASLKEIANEPKRVFFRLPDIDAFLTRYELNTGITLAPAQKEAVKMALLSPISIISGGPGTGKTQTINTIMAAIRELAPDASIRACAPTGKAAIRITELTGIPAATIHRALGLGRYQGRLKNGELVCDFMFVDEFSMADINLCAKLFDALSPNGRIVLVGDYNQLPSVGPGLVLRDFIASGVIPKVILRQIFRQSGTSRIVENAHRIINQSPGSNIVLKLAKKPGGDFYFISENDPRRILQKILRSIKQMKNNYGYGIDSVQVLSPIRYGDLGIDNLNYILQQILNPSTVSIGIEEKEFRLGDKVTHVKNNYDLGVFNGEVGFITDIAYTKDRALKVTYPDRDVWYPMVDIKELELAYALTVHKMQGSEYPVIIMPVHELQGLGLSKNLIYTALTRAKKMVVLIGSASSLSNGLRRETTIERESNLVGRIQNTVPPIKYIP